MGIISYEARRVFFIMKRISILALPLILTSFFTVLVSRIVIFFIPEIAVLFGASREAFPMWRRSVADLKLTIPILSGVIVMMLICGIKCGTRSGKVLKAVLVAAVAVGFTALTVLTAKINGTPIVPLIRSAM